MWEKARVRALWVCEKAAEARASMMEVPKAAPTEWVAGKRRIRGVPWLPNC